MSEARADQRCLNCGARLGDARYCPRCGQEDREAIQSVGGLLGQYLCERSSLSAAPPVST